MIPRSDRVSFQDDNDLMGLKSYLQRD
jgi:hypothetical protein